MQQAERQPAKHGAGHHDYRADVFLRSVLAEDDSSHHGVERGEADQGREPETPLALAEDLPGRLMQPFVDAPSEGAFLGHCLSPSWEKPRRVKSLCSIDLLASAGY